MTIRADTDELIAFLDSLAKVDPVAMGALIAARVPCNDALSDHQTVQTGDNEVGLLGILNGYAGTIDSGPREGWGPISAFIELDGRCTGFACTQEPSVQSSDQPPGIGGGDYRACTANAQSSDSHETGPVPCIYPGRREPDGSKCRHSAATMKSPEDIVKETAQKLLDFHLGKGPQPDWNDLFQGFSAAQELLADANAQSSNGAE